MEVVCLILMLVSSQPSMKYHAFDVVDTTRFPITECQCT